jgi:ABC-2 type transport system ATP-binding protein
MSLQVLHLTKNYGPQKAVNDISFQIGKGEIVGFLGPNGAGKSTTMKIATGYLPPSSGTVIVDGMDVIDHSLGVRKVTGYLPENNPLYLDMFVHEYLHFIGRVYDIPTKSLKKRISEIIELCGLTREQNKKIEQLSKGYRQRVGIAQALIHDPAVLILDEPTSGLDPNQILEIRKLIREISANKTVIFSTHILQEVQALCDRVVVINLGEIVADDTVENLMRAQSKSVAIIVEFAGHVDEHLLGLVPGIKRLERINQSSFLMEPHDGMDLRAAVFRFAADHSLSLLGLRQQENSLEEIFRQLTINHSPS